jgi:hypothetical protein
MWAVKDNEHEVGRGLLLFIFWMVFQATVITVLDCLWALPGDILGMERPEWYGHFYIDLYTMACGEVGAIYTAIGCAIMLRHEVNSRGWWKWIAILYPIYLFLAYALFIDAIGWRVIDAWSAPLLWIGEIELIYHLQKRVSEKGRSGVGLRDRIKGGTAVLYEEHSDEPTHEN